MAMSPPVAKQQMTAVTPPARGTTTVRQADATPPTELQLAPALLTEPMPISDRTSPPEGPASFLVIADAAADVQEGLLWLLREPWPRLRQHGAERGATLVLHGAGWGRRV